MSDVLAIYGSSGFARELAWLAEQQERPAELVAFIDDDVASHGQEVNGLPVMSLDALRGQYPNAGIALGIGAPSARESVADRVRAAGFSLASLVHPRVERSRWVTMGDGVVICAGSIITTNIALSRGAQVNLDCTIGHDVVLREFATLAPGVHISGNVHIGRRAYLGTGAVVINGTSDRPLVIGNDAVIGAAACVTRDVADGVTVVGIPARARDRS